MPLVLEAMPSLDGVWDPEASLHPGSPGGRLGYYDAGVVAFHAVDVLAAGGRDEVAALLRVVERFLVEGDHYVHELASIGYLEDLQNAVDRHPDLTRDDVVALLGREGRRWWKALDRFWRRAVSNVYVDDIPYDDEPSGG